MSLNGTQLHGRDAVVVGGTGNVGTFLVDGFIRAGARVFVPSRTPAKIDHLRGRLGPDKAKLLIAIDGDIGTPDGAAEIQLRLRDLSDSIFAAAAAPASWHQTRSMLGSGFAEFKHVTETRLYPHYLAAEALLPLIDPEGSYTTINGPAGFTGAPAPGVGAIAVMSIAQSKLIQAIARETGGRPRVNEVIMTAFMGPDGTRPGSPLTGEEVGDFVAALASPLGASIHGQTINLRDPRQVDLALTGTFTGILE